MDILNHQVYTSKEALDVLMKVPFKGTVVFKMAKTYKKIMEQYETLELTKSRIILKYNPEGMIDRSHEKFNEFVAEWGEILQSKLDLDVERIKLSELSLEDHSLEPEKLVPVIWLIDDSE